MGVLLLIGVVYLYATARSELAPTEDQGIVLVSAVGPPNSTVNQMQGYADQVFQIASKEPEYKQMFADDSTIDTTTTAMTDQSEVMPILKNRKIRVEAFSDAPPMKRVPKKEKDVKEHFSNHVKPTDCVGILEHIQECPICSMEYNELSHGTFFREFILFAGSGILMFLFLDLIHRIKK
jgi:multidrug efflux pump subunit AcrB